MLTREAKFRILVTGLPDYKREELWAIFHEMEKELQSLRVFKANVDEALNTGDGSYRP